MKMLTIREAFKLRLSLIMTLNNVNPFQITAKTSSSSPYLEFTILYKYGLPYLIYLPTTKVFVQTFFLEKVWLEDTLPTTVWTYVRNFIIYVLEPSPNMN